MSSAASGVAFSRSRLVFWYTLFAAVSMAANLGSQKLAYDIYQAAYAVPISVCIGTGVGLIVKYLLDKAWIFRYEHRSVAHGVRTFTLYVAMGLGTTFVFWAVEFAADALSWRSSAPHGRRARSDDWLRRQVSARQALRVRLTRRTSQAVRCRTERTAYRR